MSGWKQQVLSPSYGPDNQIIAASATYQMSEFGLTSIVQLTNIPCDPSGNALESQIPVAVRKAVKSALQNLLASIPD